MFKHQVFTKKKLIFEVSFCIEELLSIPFLSSLLFAKVKLASPFSNFKYQTKKYEVCNHTVRINEHIIFNSKILTKSDGTIQPLLLHISICRELLGGKSFEKLGYIHIDLAQYAGSGTSSQHYLMQNSHSRTFNSILKVKICLKQISGDPCFKVGISRPVTAPRLLHENQLNGPDFAQLKVVSEQNKKTDISNSSDVSTTGYNSLPQFYIIDDPTPIVSDSIISSFPFHIQWPCIIDSEFDTRVIRKKRLSTIDHPSERVFSSRISATNVVEDVVNRESPQYSVCSDQYVAKCLLNLDKTGMLTLTNTKTD